MRRLVPVGANRIAGREPSGYLRRPGDSEFRAFKLDVMHIEAGLIAEITTFNAELFPAFGLPPTLLAFPSARTCHGRRLSGSVHAVGQYRRNGADP